MYQKLLFSLALICGILVALIVVYVALYQFGVPLPIY